MIHCKLKQEIVNIQNRSYYVGVIIAGIGDSFQFNSRAVFGNILK